MVNKVFRATKLTKEEEKSLRRKEQKGPLREGEMDGCREYETHRGEKENKKENEQTVTSLLTKWHISSSSKISQQK